MFKDPPGATKGSTQLPQPAPGLKYLDMPPGTTPDEFLAQAQTFEKEVFAFAHGNTIAYASVVGERGYVDIDSFASLLKDAHWLHCHPELAPFSRADLASLITHDGRKSTVRLPDGRTMTLERPATGWPNYKNAMDAYGLGLKRGLERGVGKNKERRFKSLFAELKQALAKAGITIDVQ